VVVEVVAEETNAVVHVVGVEDEDVEDEDVEDEDVEDVDVEDAEVNVVNAVNVEIVGDVVDVVGIAENADVEVVVGGNDENVETEVILDHSIVVLRYASFRQKFEVAQPQPLVIPFVRVQEANVQAELRTPLVLGKKLLLDDLLVLKAFDRVHETPS